MADGRAWELVSPAEKDGASIEPLSREGGLIQASQNGEAIAYVANGPVVRRTGWESALEPTQVLSARTSEGWGVEDLVTPHERGEGLKIGEAAEYRSFSEDLALGLVQTPAASAAEPLEAPPLAPGSSEKTLYLRDDPSLSPEPGEANAYAAARANEGFLAPGYAPLVTPAQVTSETKPGEKTRFGGHLAFVDATPDLAHVDLRSGCTAACRAQRPGCTSQKRAAAFSW